MDATPLLLVQDLHKCYCPTEGKVVAQVSFAVQEEEIFALLGPSGCGKTTILRMIGGFERPDQGRIILRSRTLSDAHTWIRPEKRGIGFVFQEYALFPHLDVRANVMFGLHHLPKSARPDRADEMLRLVGLQKLAHRKPHELSGGQQQRVALARAMAPKPQLILLDEPFSNLDAVLRNETRDELRLLLKEAKMSAILVTHDQEEAFSFADRIGVMQEGHLEQLGTPEELYYEPNTLFVAQFLGKTNLFFSEAAGNMAESPVGTISLKRAAKGDVLVALRPEHLDIRLVNEGDPIQAEVISKDFRGHDITYRLRQKGLEFLVHTDNRHRFNVGDRVSVKPVEPGVVLKRA
ncbi:MAG: ABC transporter ATP-binding protein [Bacteroidetes Order II. Incertae sedis bacterium]|nr:ABC transporter ATP-binding protein [Bacteroidetes Order II. bacterium]